MRKPTSLQDTENRKTRTEIWITLKSEAEPPSATWRTEPTVLESKRNLH
jgi:hypothetical protein